MIFLSFLKKDFIFHQGDKSKEMYFVRKGKLEVLVQDDGGLEREVVVASLGTGISDLNFFSSIYLYYLFIFTWTYLTASYKHTISSVELVTIFIYICIYIFPFCVHLVGAFFGEISMLTGQTRTASIRASTKCELYCLSKEDFDEVSLFIMSV